MKQSFSHLDDFRLKQGEYATNCGDRFGIFRIPFRGQKMIVMATDGAGAEPCWEHVSVSLKNRCPNWLEMNCIKNLFWDEEETVIQFHPPKSRYVNQHENCLHLWKKPGVEVELPPSIYVGI